MFRWNVSAQGNDQRVVETFRWNVSAQEIIKEP